MVQKIKDSEVAGIMPSSGKCPSCKSPLINRDVDYTFIKTRGLVKHNNGEEYIKCGECGKFVMLPKKAA